MKALLFKNLPKIISVVGIIILFVCFGAFLSTSTGQVFLSSLMKEFPFFNFVYSTYNKIVGFENQLAEISLPSFSEDLIKLFIVTLVSSILFSLLTKLFNNIRIPRNQILDNGKNYEYIEETMKTPLFWIKNTAISIVSKLVGVGIGSFVIKLIVSQTTKIQDSYKRKIVYILLVIIFYCGYCLVNSILRKTTLHFAIFKTFIFSVLPELILTFVTTSLMLLIYFDLKNFGFSIKTIGLVLLLLIWCAVSEWFCDKLKVIFLQQSSGADNHLNIPNCFAATTYYLSMFIYYFFGYVMSGQSDYFEDNISKLFFNLRDFPFFVLIQSGNNISDLLKNQSESVFQQIARLFLFVVLVSVFQNLIRNKKGVSRYIGDCFMLVAVVVSYSLILYCSENVSIFSIIMIAIIVIAMLFKKFYSLVNFLEYILMSVAVIIAAIILSVVFEPDYETAMHLCYITVFSGGIWYVLRRFLN
ncbi:MAG: hypothetical protein IJE19_07490 [Clostridia bacterium]|nr:hypothetical protein [Clostridia bacterium]